MQGACLIWKLPSHGQLSRALNLSGSQAESPLPAPEHPTVHHNAPHSTGTTTTTFSAPCTKIGTLLGLVLLAKQGSATLYHPMYLTSIAANSEILGITSIPDKWTG